MSRPRVTTIVLMTSLASLLSFLLTSCGAPAGPEPNTLRVNLGSEPPSLDWHVSTDSTSFDVVSNLMVGLTQYRNDLSCAPACADSWEVTENGTKYTFHLRKGTRWSDGKPLVAGDFEYAWKRLLDPKTAAQYAFFLYDIVNAYEFNTGKIKDPSLIAVKAVDDFTLEVKLKKPAAYFINLTAFCPSFPQRKDIVEKYGDRWTEPENIVTNGPFRLTKWEHEYKIDLEANPMYMEEGVPKLKKVKMFMVPEQATAFALYENNELDFIDNRSFSTPDVIRCKNSPEYHNYSLLRNNYLGFNVTKEPVDDPRVRQAISMAIDRNVFPIILKRNELPSNTWIPPGLKGYSPSSGLQFDPVRARQLLADAGFKDGKGFPRIGLLFPNREDTKIVMETVQDQLKKNLGIPVDLVNQEWKVYLATLHTDSPPVFRGSWGADFADPETFANLFTSDNGNNNTRWKNKKYDKLVSDAAGEQNPEKRARLYEEADHYLCSEEVPVAPLYLATQNIMVKPWVHGIGMNKLDLQYFKDVTVDPH
jgi:oligopeptide transport system substrate-binding protein